MNTTGTPNHHPVPERRGFASAAIPLAILTVVTMLAFVNAWPNKLVLDDKAFAGPGRPPQLDSIEYIFTHDLWEAIGTTTGLYRPLLLLELKLETRVFGDWLPGYHLSNIFLHLLATFLLYGFLRLLLRITADPSASPDLYALLAAMVFAVHPVHTEVVNSVFNRSEMMVAILGLAGLSWLLRHLDTHPARAWLGLALVFFPGLLFRESAVVIPALAVALIVVLWPGGFLQRVRKFLPVFWLLIPLAIYLFMRAHALAPPESGGGPAESGGGAGFEAMFAVENNSGSNVFLDVPGILGESLKVIVWPYPLQLVYGVPSVALCILYAALNLLLIITSFIQLRRRHYGLATGMAFYYVAMLPATQILSSANVMPHVAERYLYFPSVGLAILLAFGARVLALRFGARVPVALAMPVLLFLTALTLDRNADWANEIALFGTEYQRSPQAGLTLRLVTSAYINVKDHARVAQICDDHQDQQKRRGNSTFVQNCALAYEAVHRFDDAERDHLFAIAFESTRVAASLSLARFYLRHGRPDDAEKQYLAAIGWTDEAAAKDLYSAEMVMSLHPRNRERWIEARNYLEEALLAKPGWPQAESLLRVVDQELKTMPQPALKPDSVNKPEPDDKPGSPNRSEDS